MNAKAAKPEKVNKSDEIRKMLEKGITSPKEVVAALAEEGIEVPSSLVSIVKNKLAGGSATVSGSAKPKAGELTLPKLLSLLDENGGLAGIEKSIKAVEAAQEHQKLIDKLGGATKAREMIDTIKKLK